MAVALDIFGHLWKHFGDCRGASSRFQGIVFSVRCSVCEKEHVKACRAASSSETLWDLRPKDSAAVLLSRHAARAPASTAVVSATTMNASAVR